MKRKSINPDALSALFRFKRKLEAWYKDTGLKVYIQDFSKAETRIEGGKTYHYPATMDIKVENQNNWFYSFRLADGMFIREGRDLSGKGQTVAQVYRLMAKEARARRGRLFKSNLDSITHADITNFRKSRASKVGAQ